MGDRLPSHARVVIVGGGVIGASSAYHLTRLGWSDVVLLERDQRPSGARASLAPFCDPRSERVRP